MAKVVATVAALAVFAVWMSAVGNPHVVETVLGLVIAGAVGLFVWRKMSSRG